MRLYHLNILLVKLQNFYFTFYFAFSGGPALLYERGIVRDRLRANVGEEKEGSGEDERILQPAGTVGLL